MKKGFIVFLLVSILFACQQEKLLIEKHEGIIAKIEKEETAGHGHDGWYTVLLISNVGEEDIDNMTDDMLIRLAQENDSAYYGVNPKMFDKLDLEIGMKVIVHWDGSQGDSDPPVRDAGKIELITD